MSVVKQSIVLSYRRRNMPIPPEMYFTKNNCSGLNYGNTDATSGNSNEPKYGPCAWAYELKEAMREAGWEVYRSCDGAQISTSDLWTTRAFQKHMIYAMWETVGYGMTTIQNNFGPEMLENNIWCCLRRTDVDGKTLHICIVPKLAWSGNSRVENYRNTKFANVATGDYGQHFLWPLVGYNNFVNDNDAMKYYNGICNGTSSHYSYLCGGFCPAIMLGLSTTEFTGGELARAVPEPDENGIIIGRPRVSALGDKMNLVRGFYMKGLLPTSESGVMWNRPMVFKSGSYPLRATYNNYYYHNTFATPYLEVICYEGNQLYISARRGNEAFTWRNWMAVTKFQDSKGAYGWAATGPKGVSPYNRNVSSGSYTGSWMTPGANGGSTGSWTPFFQNGTTYRGFANSEIQSSSSFAGDPGYFPPIEAGNTNYSRSTVNAHGQAQQYVDVTLNMSEMEHGRGSDFVMVDENENHRCGTTAGPDLRAPRSLNGLNMKGEIIRSVPFVLSALFFCDGTKADVYNNTLDGGKYPDEDLKWLGYYDDALLITTSQHVNNFSEVDNSKYTAYRSGYGSLLIRKPAPYEADGDLGINLLTDCSSNVDWNPNDGTIHWDLGETGSASGDDFATETGLT